MQSHGTQQNNALDLANKLKVRMEEQTQEMQQIMQDALRSLSDELQKSVKHELNTIENVLAEGTKQSNSMQKEVVQSLRRTLKLPVGITILVTVVGCIGLISLTSLWFQYEKSRLAELRQTNAKLQAQVDGLGDWQITINNVDGIRFLAFPKGTTLSIRKTTSGHPAVILED